MRMINRADVIQQRARYMWVLPAESPLGLGSLYVRSPFKRKGKVEIPGGLGGKVWFPVLGRMREGSFHPERSEQIKGGTRRKTGASPSAACRR
jgi:hypothetical protein